MNDKYRVSSSVVSVGNDFRVDIRAVSVSKADIYAFEESMYFDTYAAAQAYTRGFRSALLALDALEDA